MSKYIVKRGKTWSAIVYLGVDPLTGRQRQEWLSGYRTKREAEEARKNKLADIAKKSFSVNDLPTLRNFAKYWIEDVINPSALNPKSKAAYSDNIRLHIDPVLGDYKIDQITPREIQSWLTGLSRLKFSPRTQQYAFRTLSIILKTAMLQGYIPINPCQAIKQPKVIKNSHNTLTAEQAQMILDKTQEDPMYIVICLALLTGARRSEILALRWQDIDFANDTLFIKKATQRETIYERKGSQKSIMVDGPTKNNSSNRSMVMCGELKTKLLAWKTMQDSMKKWPADEDHICTWPDGRRLQDNFVSHHWSLLATKLKVNVKFHELRHTFATLMLANNVHPKVVQEMLGHSSITVTMDIYSHSNKQMQVDATQKLASDIFRSQPKASD